MIHVDGAEKSGSGTILRSAVALSSLLGEQVHIHNIRARRAKPGLRPQHLSAVKACAEMCKGEIEGAAVGSTEIIFRPGGEIRGGHYQWEIGTAGSTTLLVMTLLPLALFAYEETALTVSGGLFQDFAPSAHHMQHVLFPALQRMGAIAQLDIVRPGYVPKGGGVIRVKALPVRRALTPLTLVNQGSTRTIKGIALSSHLSKQRVSQRMAEQCSRVLAGEGFHSQIERLEDQSAFQAGASLAVWAETDSGCLIGSDQAGKRGRSSESIGRYVATGLIEDLRTGATVDRYVADQLIVYAALATGTTEYVIPRLTDHVETNLWVAQKWGARACLEDHRLSIDGLGYTRRTKPIQ